MFKLYRAMQRIGHYAIVYCK